MVLKKSLAGQRRRRKRLLHNEESIACGPCGVGLWPAVLLFQHPASATTPSPSWLVNTVTLQAIGFLRRRNHPAIEIAATTPTMISAPLVNRCPSCSHSAPR